MSEIPTPETDAEHAQFAMGGFTLDFCRKLERERDQLRSQRDGAREVAKFWQEQYAEAYPNHQWVNLPWEDRK